MPRRNVEAEARALLARRNGAPIRPAHPAAGILEQAPTRRVLEDAPEWAEVPAPEVRLPLSLGSWLKNPKLHEVPRELVGSLVWEGRCTILSGLPKSGKSTLAGLIAATLSTGGEMFGQQLTPASTLWLALDEYVGDTLRRLKAYGADPEQVFVEPKPPENAAELVAWVKALDVKLVVIDTAASWWRGVVRDSNDAEQVRAFLSPYITAMRDLGVALIILHHASKVGLRASGSVALEAEPDASLVLVHPAQRKLLNASGANLQDDDDAEPDDGRRIVQGVSRFSPHIKLRLRFEGDRFVADAGGESRRERILAVVRSSALLKGELAVRAGGNKKRTLDLIGEMEAAGDLAIRQGRYYVDGGTDLAL